MLETIDKFKNVSWSMIDSRFWKLLSKTSSLPKEIRIKPDMSPTECHTESVLLKERWSLIQAGCNRKKIKI